ncbi:MAG: phage portal protein [Omnitrophica bacterium RIFCSPHIGHO2_02_FULL_51_18]|nr:MAG: phage portal protein [Omnitrophica bacterium RIFCSPHIGHO2_02_FULL_51_18]
MKNQKTISEKITAGIDNVISFFSPKAGFKRRMYREANNVSQKFGAYKGASRDRLRSSWIPGGGSADQDLLPELSDIRERSRDLNRNDAHASGITSTMTVNVIGTGIRPQSRVDKEELGIDDKVTEEFQRKAERIWKRWIPYADAGERMDFYEIQQLVDRQILENGEAIIVPLRLEEKDRPYPLALQLIESDRLNTPPDKKSDKAVRSGVRIGENGEPVSYFIQKTHPGDISHRTREEAMQYIEIQAKGIMGRKNIFHLYYVSRSGQTRGVPFFAPVLTYFKDLAEYAEAELVAARIAACFSLFITSEASMDVAVNSAYEKNQSGQIIESLEPGMIKHLMPGESITSFNPQRPSATFEPFVDRILRAISAALGLPYELVAKDFSKTNYSSARAALLEARRYFKVRQEWLAQKLCQPVWEMLLEEAYLRGEIDAGNFYEKGRPMPAWVRARWIAPGWSWVDPLKEVKASREAIAGNISSLADEVAGQGKDWEEILEQRAREEQKRKELDLPEMAVGSKTPKDEEDEETKQEEEIRQILEDAEEVSERNEKLSSEIVKMGNDNGILKKELSDIKTRLEKVLVNG